VQGGAAAAGGGCSDQETCDRSPTTWRDTAGVDESLGSAMRCWWRCAPLLIRSDLFVTTELAPWVVLVGASQVRDSRPCSTRSPTRTQSRCFVALALVRGTGMRVGAGRSGVLRATPRRRLSQRGQAGLRLGRFRRRRATSGPTVFKKGWRRTADQHGYPDVRQGHRLNAGLFNGHKGQVAAPVGNLQWRAIAATAKLAVRSTTDAWPSRPWHPTDKPLTALMLATVGMISFPIIRWPR
jgi:hypothetical protein